MGTCADCAWWQPDGEFHRAVSGECRVNPPVVLIPPESWNGSVVTRFPETAADVWCRRWKRRPAPEPF